MQQRELEKARACASDSCAKIRFLEDRSIDQEARSRRNNIVVFGVDETERENCVDIVRKEVLEKCGVRSGEVIERAHRVGRPVRGKSRPLIARLLDYTVKERVMRARRDLPKHIRVGEDLPFPIREARKQLLPDLKAARDQGKDAFFAYPCRLIVAGEEAASLRPCFGPSRGDNRSWAQVASQHGGDHIGGRDGGPRSNNLHHNTAGRGDRGGHRGGR